MYYNNGFKYEGEWKNGLREGKGIYYLNKDNLQGDRYEGDFIKVQAEGKGISYYSNGDRYIGEY